MMLGRGWGGGVRPQLLLLWVAVSAGGGPGVVQDVDSVLPLLVDRCGEAASVAVVTVLGCMRCAAAAAAAPAAAAESCGPVLLLCGACCEARGRRAVTQPSSEAAHGRFAGCCWEAAACVASSSCSSFCCCCCC
jgi:hypothetical protein